MSSYWQVTNRNASGNATVTQNAPTASAFGGCVLRVTNIQATGPINSTLTVTDSVLGVIFQLDALAAGPLNSGEIDLRGAVGANLTFAFASSSGVTDVNAQGDFVPIGYPRFQP